MWLFTTTLFTTTILQSTSSQLVNYLYRHPPLLLDAATSRAPSYCFFCSNTYFLIALMLWNSSLISMCFVWWESIHPFQQKLLQCSCGICRNYSFQTSSYTGWQFWRLHGVCRVWDFVQNRPASKNEINKIDTHIYTHIEQTRICLLHIVAPFFMPSVSVSLVHNCTHWK